jgi:hypothetical protein
MSVRSTIQGSKQLLGTKRHSSAQLAKDITSNITYRIGIHEWQFF